MQCKKCGLQIESGSKFCRYCSAEQDESPNPGKANYAYADFSTQTEFIDQKTKKNGSRIKRWLNNYSNFGKLSLKYKLVYIAVPIICLMFILHIFDGASTNYRNDKDAAIICAVAQIKEQTFARDETVYDIKVVDSDGCGRYIITATTKPDYFETWWAVLVRIDPGEETYFAYANYHGDGITADQWVQKYKTERRYNWGVERE